MSANNGKLPPQIMEQLRTKGWTWPPSDAMKRQWREARSQFLDTAPIDPDVRREVIESFPGRFPETVEAD